MPPESPARPRPALAAGCGRPCRVVELHGPVGSPPAIKCCKGFEQAIAAVSNVSILRSQRGEFIRTKGKEVTQGMLNAEGAGRSLCAVCAQDDEMVTGAIKAIKEAGLAPGKTFVVLSTELLQNIFAAMAAGEANDTAELTPTWQARRLRCWKVC